MKPDLILSAVIVLTLISLIIVVLYTIMQPIEPICEKEGSPIPCVSAEKGLATDG